MNTTTQEISCPVSDEARLLGDAIDVTAEEAQQLLDDGDWRVLTDAEADEAAQEYILESAWAFRPSFLASHSDVADEEVFKAIADNGKCEDNSRAVVKLLRDVDHFVSDAILSDGRGHFISQYDGEELELPGNLYAYRCN